MMLRRLTRPLKVKYGNLCATISRHELMALVKSSELLYEVKGNVIYVYGWREDLELEIE